ncbi:UNVERIFIED_CONTAM: hypothetical protein FKN15_022527 [Acipenser sinensis]
MQQKQSERDKLRSLKLGNGTEIAIQPLVKEENLGLQELLLYLQVGVPAEQQYYPAEELVWDTSRGSSSRALRQAVTSHYSLPPDKTLIAMYCQDKSHWMPISSWSRQVSRKKKQQPESLQGVPFHLRDRPDRSCLLSAYPTGLQLWTPYEQPVASNVI